MMTSTTAFRELSDFARQNRKAIAAASAEVRLLLERETVANSSATIEGS